MTPSATAAQQASHRLAVKYSVAKRPLGSTRGTRIHRRASASRVAQRSWYVEEVSLRGAESPARGNPLHHELAFAETINATGRLYEPALARQ